MSEALDRVVDALAGVSEQGAAAAPVAVAAPRPRPLADVNTWFEAEDPEEHDEEPWEFDEAELAFLATLRTRAAAWRVPSASSTVGRPEDESSLLVHVSLLDEKRSLVLGEWAVHFYGAYVRAGKVCDQLFNLHESPERGFFRASGTVEELAQRCADWFESLLSRPVVRAEWSSRAGTAAIRWEFADTDEALVISGAVPADGSPPDRRILVRPSTGLSGGSPQLPAPHSSIGEESRESRDVSKRPYSWKIHPPIR